MENFNLLDGSDTLKASRDTINNNLLSVRSLSSGAAFPTDNLSVGMLCYRTDLKRLYQYQENGSWSADIAMNINGNANTANIAGTAATANRATVADSCTGNSATATTAETCTGNSATATKLKSARNINEVAFDGTTDITIDVGVKTINAVSPDADGNIALQGLPVTHIPADSNLDDYTETGVYTCWLTDNAKSLTNNPMSEKSTGIILDVTEDGNNIFQKIYGTLVPGMYTRRRNNGSWNEWKKLYAEYATTIGDASTTKPAVVVTTYKSDSKGYRVWSDGFIEQWGTTSSIDANSHTVTLPKAFTSTNYHVNFVVVSATETKDGSYGHQITARTTTSFTVYDFLMNGMPVTWYACGF